MMMLTAPDHRRKERTTEPYTIVAIVPPSADHAAPATLPARSEHRNTTTSATSCGVPNRPRGILLAAASSASSRVIPRAAAT